MAGQPEAQVEEPRVYVVDDDAAIRAYLQWLIESVGLRAELYESPTEFLAAYDPQPPSCLLLDVRLPGLSGFEVQELLQERRITIPIIMMTGYGEVPMAVRAMKQGAMDFIEKPLDGQMVLDRVQKAIARDRAQRRESDERERAVGLLQGLTPRQRDVLEGLLAGKASKEIAAALGVSPSTVDVHRSRLMQRLNVDSLAGLFRLVQRARDQLERA